MNATTAKGIAHRKTGCRASEYACPIASLSAAGSVFSSAGLAWELAALNPGGSVIPRNAAASSRASWLEKIAPNTDTPKAPPILRKKVTPDVAAPRSA